ncbi:MAG: hypothetical protein K6E91_06575 [Butyrivibrio sp.]|nr:hypothetical protein [Butyrivibrio sp.]
MKRFGVGFKYCAFVVCVGAAASGCGDAKVTTVAKLGDEDSALKDGLDAVIGSVDEKLEDFKEHSSHSLPTGPNISGNEVGPDFSGYIMTPDYSAVEGNEESAWQYGSLYGGRGDHEPEYSYDGLTVTIDGNEISFSDVAPAVNAITDVMRVGDWLIFVGHVNPEMNIYEFYNVNKAPAPEFDYEIAGTSLCWQEDDLSTAVYCCNNTVYDFWGNEIATPDNGKITGLSIRDSTTIEIRYIGTDSSGSEAEAEMFINYEPCDREVLLYYEFLLGGRGQWFELLDKAPEDALLLVIVNPPEMVKKRMIVQFGFEENADDALAVIALRDYQQIHIEKSDYDETQNQMNAIGMSGMGMGEALLYKMNIPENEAAYTLFVKAGTDGKAKWDIKRLSGEKNKMSKFIIAGE